MVTFIQLIYNYCIVWENFLLLLDDADVIDLAVAIKELLVENTQFWVRPEQLCPHPIWNLE
jgi:hypothetical protein